MEPARRTAVLAGALYLVTHVTSVGAVLLYGPMLTTPGWTPAAGPSPQLAGALLDVVLALAVVGTAVALHPLLRHRAPGGSIAYVGLRTLEASAILGGAVAVLAALSLGAAHGATPGGAPGGATTAAASAVLLGTYDAAFTVMGLVVPVHTVVLAFVLLRHRLVATWIPVLGIVGAMLVGASNLAVVVGLQPQVSTAASLAAVPVFAWEIALAVTLITRGLRAVGAGNQAPVGSVEQPYDSAVVHSPHPLE